MYETKSSLVLEKEFNTSIENGLSSDESNELLRKNGLNVIETAKKKSIFIKFLLQFKDPMIYVLLFAGVISFVLKEWADGAIILFVILLNAIVGTIQEARAEKALDALKKMSSPTCFVRRDGKMIEIPASEVVVGDLIVLEEGNIVPADIRLTKSFNIKADESSLTGESVPVEKRADIV